MLTLPETLLLFALHDERGTVRSEAWLGLDESLHAAVLAEHYLRGHIRVRPDGTVEHPLAAPDTNSPLLARSIGVLRRTKPTDVERCREVLEDGMPDVRDRVLGTLIVKDILEPAEIDRPSLADSDVHPTEDDGPELHMRAHLRTALHQGVEMSRRMGMLLGLVHVNGLFPALLPKSERDIAVQWGEWVKARDPIIRMADIAVRKAEGSYEG
jgi:hypothetical protein